MAFLDELPSIEHSKFTGPNLLVDEEDVKDPDGLFSKDVEYLDGQVRTRRGFAEAINPNKVIPFLYNWLESQFNRLLYYSPPAGTMYLYDLVTGSTAPIVTGLTTAIGATVAKAG